MVVIGDNPPLMDMKIPVPKDTDIKIAEAIIPYISDGCMLQLGIGGLPASSESLSQTRSSRISACIQSWHQTPITRYIRQVS